MDPLSPVRRFDAFQRRSRPAGVIVAVLKKFSDDQAGNEAALIAYFGFFSLFPLLLLFVTVLGFVLQGDDSARHAIVNSALKQFPIVGGDLGKNSHALNGSGIGLAVGLIGSLLSGLGITMAAQNAFNTVYAVPFKERPNFLQSRLQGLKLLVVFGGLQVFSTVAAGLVAGGFGGVGTFVLGLIVSLALNLVLFFAVFRLLTDRAISTRELRPGIITAAVLWEIVQLLGGAYIGHVIKGAGQTYGTFATVIGLLVWLYLGARVLVYSAEINTVLTRELWPRSILDPPTPADRRARAALVKSQERDDKETVDVTFHPDLKVASDPANPPYAVAPQPAPGEDAETAPLPDGLEASGVDERTGDAARRPIPLHPSDSQNASMQDFTSEMPVRSSPICLNAFCATTRRPYATSPLLTWSPDLTTFSSVSLPASADTASRTALTPSPWATSDEMLANSFDASRTLLASLA